MGKAIEHKNPFVGLRAFEEDEDYLFFGRSAEINDLLKKFAGSRFLAVIGSSGSGKSSLVKSGLLPAIYSGFLSVGHNWRVAVMRPGNDPVGNLAKELAKEKVLHENVENSGIPFQPIIESTLRRSGNGLTQVYKEAHLPSTENLLIVVDQFEELFRFSKYEKLANQGISDSLNFITLLLNASQQSECPVFVLITMRSDFLGDCSQFRGLPEAINVGQYLVPRMTRDKIKEAITGPIAVGGAKITQRLLTRLLNNVGNDFDQLPILQHAMMRTWDAWELRSKHNEAIDIEDYDKIGGMKEALSIHANEIYEELKTDERKKYCELMFKALTDKSADVRGTRRPRSVKDLSILAAAPLSEIISIADNFRQPGRTFLMPHSNVPLDETTIIDISHESLMRVWKRLAKWADEEALNGETYLRLVKAAERANEIKEETGKDSFLVNPELEIALKWKAANKITSKWAEGYKGNFEEVMSFLEDSRKQDLAEKEKKEKLKRRIRMLVAFIIIGLLGGISTITYYYFEAEKAKENAETLLKKFQNSEYINVYNEVKNIADRADSLKTKYNTISKSMYDDVKIILEKSLEKDSSNKKVDSLKKSMDEKVKKLFN